MSRRIRLSKSRYQAGLQCPKLLWLRCHEPGLADPISDFQQAIFDQGHTVGGLAQRRFPGGVLIAEDHTQARAALAATSERLAAGVTRFYEAAVEYDDVLVRVDILDRMTDGTWDLIEVKSTTSVKDVHRTDAAIQAYVLRGAGLDVGRVSVMHVDNTYIYEGGEYDLERLFKLVDVTEGVEEYLPCVPGELAKMKEVLASGCPDVQIGRHCTSPYDCGFIGHCHAFLPEYPVTEIPRISAETLDALLEHGIPSMRDVPRVFPGLTPAQQTACEIVRRGTPRFDPTLLDVLTTLERPVHFLDFETFGPALPIFPGTRPYQTLPVQWSCHTLHAEGHITHAEFLHEEATDPRLPFAESLIAALAGDDSPIVVYSSFEGTTLKNLAEALPDRATALEALRGRLVDLMPLVRDYVEHPGFRGKLSLKVVLPTLVHDLSYEGQTLAHGGDAMFAYAAAVTGGLPPEERDRIFQALRSYCAVDTLGLLRVYQALLAGCGAQSGDGRGPTPAEPAGVER